ncbi:MAG: hypothetical protein ABIZ80_20130, partial [Bryobacteraceae bacterium]
MARAAAVAAILVLSLSGIGTALPPDGDGDGLSDVQEQALLEKFAPAFLISIGECDSLPAEFLPGSKDPQVVARNGTIYGQVSRHKGSSGPGSFVEVHYFHLWGRDCGRAGHALDAEHVS